MKVNKRQKSTIILFLIFTSFIFSLAITPLESDGNNSEALNLDEKVKTNAVDRTDEISTVFTWKSDLKKLYNSSYESLSLDSLVGNLTNFDPVNSTSYTDTDEINITLQPSNSSWYHYRAFTNDVSLPSTNGGIPPGTGHMINPYDTTVFFARNGASYNISLSWEADVGTFGNFETYMYLFNQSQFINFENYILPWRWSIPETVAGFNSSHNSDDWLIQYDKEVSNGFTPTTFNDTLDFTLTLNKTGWYYIVMWGPGYTEDPRIETIGSLITEGVANVNISVMNLMDLYRPSLGKVVFTITDPIKVYEKVIQGDDETYGDSLVLMYIYEFSNRQMQNTLSWVENDWVPFIIYINPANIGEFPRRFIYYQDDTWADFKDRYQFIVDPNFAQGPGIHNYSINTTAELAPFLNETISMSANVSTTPINMEDRIGSSVRLATTTNSHGFEIKPFNNLDGVTSKWNDIPRFALNNETLKQLYNKTFNEFLGDGSWDSFTGSLLYPAKTPFTLYFKSLFSAPFLVSGLENILLIETNIVNWIKAIDHKNPFFNSTLNVQVNTTIDIPVNFTLTYPGNEPGVGGSCNFNLSLGAMGNPNITIDYQLNYSIDYSMGLFTGMYDISKNDTIHFQIPLQKINFYIEKLGFEDGLSGIASSGLQKIIDKALSQSEVADYISLENLQIGDHVVGNLIKGDIRVHLWPIIKDMIKKYKFEWYPGCLIIDTLLLNESTGLDLIISPQLQGVLNGTIVADGLVFENGGQFQFNSTNKSAVFEVNRTVEFPQTNIQLQNLLYFLNFYINWTFEVNFNDFPHYLGQEDLSWFLGTYPNVNFAENPMNDSDNLTLSWVPWTIPIPDPPILSINSLSPTNNRTTALDWTSSNGADNYTLYRHTSEINSSSLISATNIKDVTGTSTTDTVPDIGRWYYAVIATNESGSSDPSNSPYIDIQNEPVAFLNSILQWKSNSSQMNNGNDEQMSFSSLAGNLTDFDPANSGSYTGLDEININLQPSNNSWSHYRDFNNDVSLPSTNIASIPTAAGEMYNPYDTTVFFARSGTVYNITASWEQNPTLDLDTNLYLFNQSQFHDFENYIEPWRAPVISTLAGFNSSASSNDWLIEYSNTTSGGGTLNHTKVFEDVTFDKTGWYYLVMWGPGYELVDKPRVSTTGTLISEGPANGNIIVDDLMDIYRPSLGKVNGFIDMPDKVYERVVHGNDEEYGDSLALIYVYEYAERKPDNILSILVDNDWVPYIAYINTASVGQFPNRIVTFFDDSWADAEDRYIKIIDPNFSLGSGNYQKTINITAELAPFLNETVIVNATVSTTPITRENRIGASVRLATTTNSHGFEIKPYSSATGTTFSWNQFPKYDLNNSTLRSLYNDTFYEFISNGWESWGGKNYPIKTPFTLYFKNLFNIPYICSGLDNILLAAPEVRTWIDNIDLNTQYFNSSLQIQTNTTIDIPVNFIITYPIYEPGVGEESNFTIELGTMGNPNITIDYILNYSMLFSMGLFSGNYAINKIDKIFFEIPLQQINLILGYFEVEDGLSGLATEKINGAINEALNGSEYISIENFTIGSHVVGDIVSCDIEIYIWPIIKHIIEQSNPDFYKACTIIDNLILNESKGLNLIITPVLKGILNGTIIGDGLEFENGGNFEFNSTQTSPRLIFRSSLYYIT